MDSIWAPCTGRCYLVLCAYVHQGMSRHCGQIAAQGCSVSGLWTSGLRARVVASISVLQQVRQRCLCCMVPSPQFWRPGSLHGPSLPPLYTPCTSPTASMGIRTPRTGRCSLVLRALMVIGASGYCTPVAALGWSKYFLGQGALGYHTRDMLW